MAEASVVRVIGGQEVKVTSPGRVYYPATGTTKTEVVDYYAAVADAMLPHLAGRPATRKRWPDGVDGPAFFAKDLEPGTPGWMSRVQILHGSGPKFFISMAQGARTCLTCGFAARSPIEQSELCESRAVAARYGDLAQLGPQPGQVS